MHTTTRKKISLPAHTFTRAALRQSAEITAHMRQPVLLIENTTTTALREQLSAARAEITQLKAAALERVLREERVAAITRRVVDNRSAYAAKLGLRTLPQVVITSRQVITADAWQAPPQDA